MFMYVLRLVAAGRGTYAPYIHTPGRASGPPGTIVLYYIYIYVVIYIYIYVNVTIITYSVLYYILYYYISYYII